MSTSTHCKKCNSKHNTLLHPEKQSGTKDQQAENSDNSNAVKGVVTSMANTWLPSRVILSTARVWIHDSKGGLVKCRILLNSGSQFNFILRELCQRLKLSTKRQNCSIKDLGPLIKLHELTGTIIQSKHTAYNTKLRCLVAE